MKKNQHRAESNILNLEEPGGLKQSEQIGSSADDKNRTEPQTEEEKTRSSPTTIYYRLFKCRRWWTKPSTKYNQLYSKRAVCVQLCKNISCRRCWMFPSRVSSRTLSYLIDYCSAQVERWPEREAGWSWSANGANWLDLIQPLSADLLSWVARPGWCFLSCWIFPVCASPFDDITSCCLWRSWP